jgi:hypothetical protein
VSAPAGIRAAGIGCEDVFTRLEMRRRHYSTVGPGAGYIDAFVR